MYLVKIHNQAIKSLNFSLAFLILIWSLIGSFLKVDPFVLDTKKLGPPHQASHRLRIGNYRIFVDINTSTKSIIILDIERRTTQTYKR